MAKHKLEIGRDELKIMLEGTWEYTDPPSILNGLSAEDACRPVAGCEHTIAGLVFHLNYWQQRTLKIAHGADSKLPDGFEFGRTDFAEVTPAEWEALRDEFLASYEPVLKCADDPAVMNHEPNEHYNVGFMLANHTLHNAYHLGQIVQMRKIQGNWVPVHGS